MKTFNFGANGAINDKSIREITRLFQRAGASVVASNVAATVTKRAGVPFRNVHLTFADGQTITLAVKETGDVFEVKVNNSVQPLREQDDHAKTIVELAAILDKKRAGFQKALARVKTVIPASLRTSRTNVLAAKIAKRDGLKEVVGLAEAELAELTAQ